MRFPSELQEPCLLELHLGCQAMGGVAYIHDAAVVDAELADNDVVDGGSDLKAPLTPQTYAAGLGTSLCQKALQEDDFSSAAPLS